MFFGAKLKRWSDEKREVVLDECDLEVLDIVVDYMYGMDIPKLVCNINEPFIAAVSSLSQDCLKLGKVLDICEMFLMADLKAEVEKLAMKMLNRANVKELCGKADKFDCPNLLHACVQLMVKDGISLNNEEARKMPDAAAACMEAFKAELDDTAACLEVFKAELDKRKDLEAKLAVMRRENNYLKRNLVFKSSETL